MTNHRLIALALVTAATLLACGGNDAQAVADSGKKAADAAKQAADDTQLGADKTGTALDATDLVRKAFELLGLARELVLAHVQDRHLTVVMARDIAGDWDGPAAVLRAGHR